MILIQLLLPSVELWGVISQALATLGGAPRRRARHSLGTGDLISSLRMCHAVLTSLAFEPLREAEREQVGVRLLSPLHLEEGAEGQQVTHRRGNGVSLGVRPASTRSSERRVGKRRRFKAWVKWEVLSRILPPWVAWRPQAPSETSLSRCAPRSCRSGGRVFWRGVVRRRRRAAHAGYLKSCTSPSRVITGTGCRLEEECVYLLHVHWNECFRNKTLMTKA